MSRVIGYTALASLYCLACARKAGMDAEGFDQAGDPIGVVFSTDETHPEGEYCDECGGEVSAPYTPANWSHWK